MAKKIRRKKAAAKAKARPPTIAGGASPKKIAGPGNAPKKVLFFLALTLLFSLPFYYLNATGTTKDQLLLATGLLMWCPAAAALLTRWYFQRDFNGFGFGWGETKWQLTGILLPIILGLAMFGCVWLTGIGPFNFEKATQMFSASFLPSFLLLLGFNLVLACGEELGWRGLLVPELSNFMGFTKLALLSGTIWALWHFPLIIFGAYHGTGDLLFSLLAFTPSVIASGVILAFLRLKSGSVWVAVSFHGFWNYFIQQFYPALTINTPASEQITGEFGWLAPLLLILVALAFWHYRDRLPKVGTPASKR